MPAPKSDPTLSAAQRADAACDSFEKAWREGKMPRVDAYVAAVPAADRDAVRSALQKVEAELRSGRGTGETSGGANAERTGSHQPRPTPSSLDGTPTHIGRFEVRAVLGAGAFGRVYRAFDPTLDREVAIKVPQPGTLQTDDDRDRFLREARSAATVSHPNVCQIFEVGRHDGQPYIVMAMVPGQSLQQALRARTEPLPERQAAIIARKIALALDAAHKKGVVHRDLKPANVMFDKERKDFVVMDFGLARRAESGDARATRSGAVMGTPAYMSPEQARGEARDVGPETDIFSLGVMLYEMLAGVRPFAGGSAHEVMGRILLMEPQVPSELRPGLDPLLEAACLKALAKDPAKRFATMGEFAAALDVFLYRPVSPSAETVRPTETKGAEGRSVTESQHLGNLFARMTTDEEEDATAVTRRPTGKKRAKKAKPAGPRWPVVGGLLVGLLLVALAGVVFFTRSGSVKATVELADIDLKDKSQTYFLDDKPVTADELSRPTELKPGEYTLEVKRDGAIVKRYSVTVTGGRSPGIKAREHTPKPGQTVVQAPPRPVGGPAKKDNEPNPNPNPNPVVPPKEPDPPPAVPSAEGGFVPLFNGRDLTGWTVESGPADQWKVEDGHIKGKTTQRGAMGWLLTDKEYANYELKLQFQIAPDGDGAIGLRGRAGEQVLGKAHRLAIKLTRYADAKKPQLGDFYYGQPLWQPAKPPAKLVADPAWHAIAVTVQGDDVTVSINGALVQQVRLSDFANKPGAFPALKWASGRIGLQLFDGEVRYRDIEIKELPPAPAGNAADGFKPLFNGKDLTGWKTHPSQRGDWRADNGVLSGSKSNQPGQPATSHLYTARDDYRDFHLKLEARVRNSTSGVYFRAPFGPTFPADNPTWIGAYNAKLDKNRVGGLIVDGVFGRPLVRDEVVPFEFDRWTALDVIAQGNRIEIKIDGKTTATFVDKDKTYTKGHIVLQQHAGAAVEFRNIRVKELPEEPAPK